MDGQLPPQPSIWDQFLGVGRVRKYIAIGLMIAAAFFFPALLLFYFGYFIYIRRKRNK